MPEVGFTSGGRKVALSITLQCGEGATETLPRTFRKRNLSAARGIFHLFYLISVCSLHQFRDRTSQVMILQVSNIATLFHNYKLSYSHTSDYTCQPYFFTLTPLPTSTVISWLCACLFSVHTKYLHITSHIWIIILSIMALKSWFNIPPRSHFSLANIPFGIISTAATPTPRPAVAIGDHALDLQLFNAGNGFSALSVIQPHESVFSSPTLNAFASLGKPIHSAVRKYIQTIFLANTPFPHVLKDNISLQKQCLIPLKDVSYHVPMQIGDYTDFFVGMNHAYNCGVLFRGPANALQPNYKHLPVGYHGRASSIVPSGTPIRRPHGQILIDPTAKEKVPVFSPSRKLDLELELGAFLCKGNRMGEPIPIGEAEDYIFGLVLLNDWSARDIQSWEYVPLGPFNAKNFATSISPWVVLTEALEPYRTKGLESDTQVLPYLREGRAENVYHIDLEWELKSGSAWIDLCGILTDCSQHPPGMSLPSGRRTANTFFFHSSKC